MCPAARSRSALAGPTSSDKNRNQAMGKRARHAVRPQGQGAMNRAPTALRARPRDTRPTRRSATATPSHPGATPSPGTHRQPPCGRRAAPPSRGAIAAQPPARGSAGSPSRTRLPPPPRAGPAGCVPLAQARRSRRRAAVARREPHARGRWCSMDPCRHCSAPGTGTLPVPRGTPTSAFLWPLLKPLLRFRGSAPDSL